MFAMCLAVPGKVLEIYNNTQPVMGKVDFSGIRKDVCLELVPDVKTGDYVVVHVGFAISIMNEEEARETLRLLEEMNNATADQDGNEGE